MKKKLINSISLPEILFKFLRIMRFSIYIILLTSMITHANVFSQGNEKFTICLVNASFQEILKEFKEQTELNFFYRVEEINEIPTKTYKIENATLEEALNELIKGTNLTYNYTEGVIVIKKKRPPFFNLKTQQDQVKIIKGTVKDKKGNLLPGVSVVIVGTINGVSTNNKGEFNIKVKGINKIILKFSFVGMKDKKVEYKGTPLNVVLEDDSANLEQVVVTGQFQRKASSFTGSAVTLKKEQLLKVSNQNIFSAIKNLDPSIMVFDNMEFGSDPNKMPNMILRGSSTFPSSTKEIDFKGTFRDNPNMPLFVLDGFEVNSEKIFDLDMNRVKSVTILKDASAKAMWGSKAANGVVVIETQREGTGRLRTTFTSTSQFQFPDLSSYDLCNSEEKLELERKSGLYTQNNYEGFNGTYKEQYYNRLAAVKSGIDTDWLSKPLRNGFTTKNAISFQIGDEKLSLLADLSYNATEGVMKGSSRNVFSGTINFSYRYKKIKFRNSLSITNNKSNDSPYGQFSEYSKLNPYWHPYDEYGNIAKDIEHIFDYYAHEDNPLYNANLDIKHQKKYTEIVNNFTATYYMKQYLRFEFNLGVSKKDTESDDFLPANHLMFKDYKEKDLYRKGSYTYSNGWSNRIDGNFSINFSREIYQKHYVFANLRYNLSEYLYQENIFKAEGFPSDKMNNILFAKQYAENTSPSGTESTDRSIGFNSSLNYTYDERYLLDFTLRRSASSKFGEKQRWGNFWSTGIGWNVHKENWLNSESIRVLKLTASIGSTGSQGNDAYNTITKYKYLTNLTYKGDIGTELETIGNKDLKWQQKLDYNARLLFNYKSRFDLNFDIYKSITENTIIDYQLPASVGFKSIKRNMGKLENNGYELSLRYTAYSNPTNQTYLNFSFRAAHNKNKIVAISDALKSLNKKREEESKNYESNKPPVKYFDGMSMTAIWAVKSAGIDPANGMEIYINRFGDYTYEYNPADQVVCGDELPEVQGNFGCNFEHKGFSFNTTFRYMVGADYYNRTLIERIENVDFRYNVDKRIFTGRWTKPGQHAKYKTLKQGMLNGEWVDLITRPTSRFVQKRNELTLSSINISYDLKKLEFMKKINLERLKLSAYMNDVFVWSTIKMERGYNYPFARSVNFSLQATF